MARIIDTKIGNDIVSIDLDNVWRETFAKWDCLVDTKTAEAIATCTEKCLTARRGDDSRFE